LLIRAVHGLNESIESKLIETDIRNNIENVLFCMARSSINSGIKLEMMLGRLKDWRRIATWHDRCVHRLLLSNFFLINES